ncbi:YeeE/YedE family protein [Prosthecodimorpha staleyi]|uniref:YeeE/YedE family protein n=1 Tax=Prosthecodimorpha staleyi TaxID=2840188 RepID=A0A947GAU5_9HYPH|nr:YeeE/YedE family protein [Prosthecodimorpha staleyi]MBT9289518.1 YeeE/YedE family protein [Prosthecodimorpha staleyi]
MSLPVSGTAALVLAVLFGFAFGWLLHRGRVASFDTIVNQFRFQDFTVLKVMLTAILVGGIGVLALIDGGLAKYHIKDANMLAVALGGGIFGIGMVLYGYCPGTAIAAMGSGSIHAAVGFFGMILGGILYALSYPWLRDNVISVAKWGKMRLPELTGLSDLTLFGILAAVAIVAFVAIERSGRTA